MKKLFLPFLVFILAIPFSPSTEAQTSYTLPQANFVVTPSVGEATGSFEFNATDSRSGNGSKSGLEYRWKLRPDLPWTDFSSSPIYRYIPMDDGKFRAILQVRDKKTGHIQTTYRHYRSTTSFDRRANIYASNLTPRAGESIRFWVDVFKVRFEDIDDIEVRWDFDGNNSWDTSFSPIKEVWHTYNFHQVNRISPRAEIKYADGTTIIVSGLRSDSSKGRYRTATRENEKNKIRVTSPAVVPPILEVSPGNYGSHPDTQFIFDTQKSRVPRGGWIEWSFDYDAFQKGPRTIRKSFDTPGEHVVQARTCVGVRTTECAVSTTTFEVKAPKTIFWIEPTITSRGNGGKLVKISDNYYETVIGQELRFSSRSRSAGNGTVSNLRYIWDLDGDGDFDSSQSTHREFTHRFTKTGRYYPTVEAINNQGVKAKGSIVIDVKANTTPKGSLHFSPATIQAGQTVNIRATLEDAEHRYKQLEVRYDANGDGAWDSGFTSPRSTSWKFEKAGKYLIRMQVKDPLNYVYTSEKVLTVTPNPLLADQRSNQHCGPCKENDDYADWSYNPPREKGSESDEPQFFTGNPESPNKPVNYYTGNRYQNQPSGQRELRIPIAPPALELHKDFKEYTEFATGWDGDTDGRPTHPNPWLSNTYYGIPNTRSASVQSNSISPQVLSSTQWIQSLQKRYQNQAIEPAYPGENPFRDVSESDWFFPLAIQAYRDGLAQGPYFFQ